MKRVGRRGKRWRRRLLEAKFLGQKLGDIDDNLLCLTIKMLWLCILIYHMIFSMDKSAEMQCQHVYCCHHSYGLNVLLDFTSAFTEHHLVTQNELHLLGSLKSDCMRQFSINFDLIRSGPRLHREPCSKPNKLVLNSNLICG